MRTSFNIACKRPPTLRGLRYSRTSRGKVAAIHIAYGTMVRMDCSKYNVKSNLGSSQCAAEGPNVLSHERDAIELAVFMAFIMASRAHQS